MARKSKSNGISLKSLLTILISVFLIVMTLSSVYFYKHNIVGVQTIEIDMKINDVGTGFVLDNDIVHLGNLKKGVNSKREINITNNYDFPVEIRYEIIGNITGMVSIGPKPLKLGPHETKEIFVNGNAWKDVGYYHGYAKLTFWRDSDQ